jgi:hypothetical protein
MGDQYYFERPNAVDLDAASIGISSQSWGSVDFSDKDKISKATALIEEKRYDIVPIIGQSGQTTEYYTLSDNGKVVDRAIGKTLHFRTPIEGALEVMVREQINHVFLTNDRGIITGLLSACNFNCRGFVTLVFSKIVRYEMAIASALREHNVETEETAEEINARKSNLDVDRFEHMSIETLQNNFRKTSFWEGAGFPSKTKYEEWTKRFPNLRNSVAHAGAGRSLIDSNRTLEDLHNTISDITDETERVIRLILNE